MKNALGQVYCPSPVHTDTSPILVLPFVLSHCCKRDENLPEEWVHALGRGGKGRKGSRAEALCRCKAAVPAFATAVWVSIWLQCFMQRGRRAEGWLGSVLCPQVFVSQPPGEHRVAGIGTLTSMTANRKAGVLCETDGDTERQCKYLDF